MAAFGPLAPHYDTLMKNVDYQMWVDYLRLLWLTHGTDPDTVLDVCCGTGTMAEILAQADYRVTGFDLSPEMIAAAKRPRAKAKYHVADASTFDFGRTYDAAYSFFDSLNYIADYERFAMALSRVRAHLEDGAPFIFDLNTEYAFRECMFDLEDMRKNLKLRFNWQGEYDPATRMIRVHMQFWTKDGERFEEIHVQRAHSPDEVVAALGDAGFDRYEVYDAYTLQAPHKKSDRVHYVAW